ncbi:MAG: hypothetical protein QXL27_07875 [Candidatus Bathyarchaeia archaeon]
MTGLLSKEEKLKILRSLEEDLEFRYAVAGLIGISEILKRMDRFEENQEKLWEEVKSLREGQEKLWENQEKLWEEVKSLREGQEKLWENQEKLWENANRLWEEVKRLREGQDSLSRTVSRISSTLERLTISVEDEARDVIRYRLKNELNVDVVLDRVWVAGREINIYGAVEDLCVVGEATVRLGKSLVDELEEKVELLKRLQPDMLKPKLVKVIYADYATPAALEYAEAKGIWVLKWSGDLTKRKL